MIYTNEKLLKTNNKEHIVTTETIISDTDNLQDIYTTEAREIKTDTMIGVPSVGLLFIIGSSEDHPRYSRKLLFWTMLETHC